MGKFRVDTDKGSYIVETEDAPSKVSGGGGSWEPQKSMGQMILGNAGMAAKKTAETAGVAANTAGFGIPGMISNKVAGKNIFAGNDLSGGEKFGAEMAGALVPIGGIIGGGIKLGKEIPIIKNMIKFGKSENRIGLADKVRNSLTELKHNTIEKFGKEYEQIIGKSNEKIDVDKVFKNFMNENEDAANLMKNNEEFGAALRRKDPNASRLQKFMENLDSGDLPKEMSSKDANELQKWIKNIPSIKTKLSKGRSVGFGQVDWTNSERLMLDLANDIKGEVVNVHPELSVLNKGYGQVMNDLKSFRGKVKTGSTIQNLKNFSQIDDETKAAATRILPKNILKEIGDFEMSDKMAKYLKQIGAGVAATAGTAAVGTETYNVLRPH